MSRIIPMVGISTLGILVLSNCVCYVVHCDPANCSGCCDAASGACISGTDDTACGAGGTTCGDCTSIAEICQAGACYQPFAGTYNVTEQVTVSSDQTGQTITTVGFPTLAISQTTVTSLLVDMPSGGSTACSVPATVQTDSAFALAATQCQSFIDNNGCTDVFTYSSGSGSLTGGANLSISASGTYTQTCPAASGTGTFSVAISGSK